MPFAKLNLNLLPFPLWAGRTGLDNAAMAVSPAVDPRIDARLDELFAGADEVRGRLQIFVAQAAGLTPMLHDDESYELRIEHAQIILQANSTWGALHGLSTVYQLHQHGQLTPGLHIQDQPRYPWRGLLLDVARHFLSITALKQVVDGMSLLKMNVLHLHLTDDQAFRFSSETYPRLASAQAYQPAQMRELVAYAGARGVRVVPELDLPGHATSWLLAYPELGSGQVAATTRFGVHEACLNPTNERVYGFLANLFAEVADIFPDQYVHIGGDEVHPTWWQEDVGIQQFMRQHQFAGNSDLQNWFNHRLCGLLAGLGKQVVGWDEVLHAETPPLIVQSWRGATSRDRALALHRQCLVSSGFYLDLNYPNEYHYQYDPGASQTALLALEDSWQADPRMAHVADGIEWTKQWRREQQADHPHGQGVLGGEACLWSELVDEQTLAVRLWSRLPAVAERLWSAAEVADLEHFYQRLDATMKLPGLAVAHTQQQRLSALGLDVAQQRIVGLLEPVKWYARLLGAAALAARLQGAEMPQARPYDTTTGLDRCVDFISPESFPAREFAQMPWQQVAEQARLWRGLQVAEWPADLHLPIAAMAVLGEQLLRWLAGEIDAATCADSLAALALPQGEYMLAVVHFLKPRIV